MYSHSWHCKASSPSPCPDLECLFLPYMSIMSIMHKAVNREDKLSRRYRDRDLAKFESSRRYRER